MEEKREREEREEGGEGVWEGEGEENDKKASRNSMVLTRAEKRAERCVCVPISIFLYPLSLSYFTNLQPQFFSIFL